MQNPVARLETYRPPVLKILVEYQVADIAGDPIRN